MNARRYFFILAAAAIAVSLPLAARSASRNALAIALHKVRPVHTKSWFKRGATSSGPLIYASLVTSLSTGETNIYQQSGSTLALVGQLSEGGGPIATDAKGNVYVAEIGSNALGYVSRNVFVYQPGATSPSLVLENPNYTSWAIAVSATTAYVAGLSVASSGGTAGVMKYQLPATLPSPGSTPQPVTGTLLSAPITNPALPTGLAVDSSGNLFAGWIPYSGSHCLRGPIAGCGTELKSTGGPWTEYLPLGQAVNDIYAGPVLTANENQTIVSIVGALEYLITFPKGSYVPSAVVSLPVFGTNNVPGIASLVVDPSGQALWAANAYLSVQGGGSSTATFRIWKLLYPSGTVNLAFDLPQDTSSSLALPFNNAVAVGPAYAP